MATITVHRSDMVAPSGTGTINPSDWFVSAFGGSESSSGVNVTVNNVLTSGPVYQAVTTIAGDLAGMEIQILRSDMTPDRLHPAWGLLNESSHDEIGAFTCRETLMSWALLHGNGLAYIEREGSRPVALIPLSPNCTYLVRDPESQRLLYVYSHPEDGTRYVFFQDEILHFRGLGTALWGESIFDLMRNSVGNSLAAERFQGRSYKNGLSPSGVFEKDGPFPDEARAELRRELERNHQGVDNALKALILSHGIKYKAMGITHKDAELLESIKFSREQIAAFFCLPPYKLGSLENSAVRANLEQSQREYLQSTLWRWICIQSNEVARKLFSSKQRERRTHTVKFDTTALVAADISSRYTAYGQGITSGWMSPNEARAKESLPPIDGGNVYLLPLNMEAYGPDAPEYEDEQDDDPPPKKEEEEINKVEEQMINFARKQFLSLQSMESIGLERKRSPEKLVEFYAALEGKIMDRLGPLAELDLFAEASIKASAGQYCRDSLALAKSGKPMDYERRLEAFLNGIQN